MSRLKKTVYATIIAGMSIVFGGCPSDGGFGRLISDCFGEDTISESEYDDLNVFEQLLYERNDCGRYESKF